jgi:lipopolysaccharide export system protein LptA
VRIAAGVLALGAAWLAVAASAAEVQAPSFGGLGLEDNGKPLNIEADQGIEWEQQYRVYIARGNVKATRGDDTIYADTLYAYYRPTGSRAAPASVGGERSKTSDSTPLADGSTEVFRVEAEGNVRLATPTQTAYGDHAVYDIDQALLVLTGKDLRLVTPRDTVTARDSLEWWDRKQLGVARGDAVAVRETKRIRGDVLTATVEKSPNQASHIGRIDADGNVVVASADQIARGDVGVYNVDTGIATLSGHVTLTRGESELRGQYAVVDLNRNIGHLLSAPPSAKLIGPHPPRVEGLLVPRPRQGAAAQ